MTGISTITRVNSSISGMKSAMAPIEDEEE